MPRRQLPLLTTKQTAFGVAAVEHEAPRALDFLRDDCFNVNNFFRRQGVATLTLREFFEWVVDPSLPQPDETAECSACLDELLARASERGHNSTLDVEDDAFRRVYVPRSLFEVKQFFRDFVRLKKGLIKPEDLYYTAVSGIRSDLPGGTQAKMDGATVPAAEEEEEEDGEGETESSSAEDDAASDASVDAEKCFEEERVKQSNRHPRNESPESKRLRKKEVSSTSCKPQTLRGAVSEATPVAAIACSGGRDEHLRSKGEDRIGPMVQLFYYEHLGQRCDQLIQVNDRRIVLELYALEGVTTTVPCTRWELRFPWFTCRFCTVVKFCGTTRSFRTRGKVMCTKNDGALFVTGKFKDDVEGVQGNPDFCIFLTSNVSQRDFHAGYILTGTLQRGVKSQNVWETTHFAMHKTDVTFLLFARTTILQKVTLRVSVSSAICTLSSAQETAELKEFFSASNVFLAENSEIAEC
nr:unnamed protein product [Spirometra erinaceieuropaei]